MKNLIIKIWKECRLEVNIFYWVLIPEKSEMVTYMQGLKDIVYYTEKECIKHIGKLYYDDCNFEVGSILPIIYKSTRTYKQRVSFRWFCFELYLVIKVKSPAYKIPKGTDQRL